MDPPPAHRATCYRCRKPARLCLCARVPEVANRTPVFVVQHRRERFHAVGTTRIARLGLHSVEVLEGVGVVPEPRLLPGAALLYPGPRARDLATVRDFERPSQLVVLDGTWHQARRLFLDNPWLQRLPRVRLSPGAPSRYRIRKQPAEHCVSTLESVVEALRLLEPETVGLDGLIGVFDTMVDEQLGFMVGAGSDPRFQRRRPRKSRALPEVLRRSPERVVLVYGETAPGVRGDRDKARQLVRWSALRVSTGEVFDRVVRPAGPPPAPGHLAHMGLQPADLDAADDLPTVARAWAGYRQSGDLLAAWHPATLRMHTWLEPDPTRPDERTGHPDHTGHRGHPGHSGHTADTDDTDDTGHAEGLALRSIWANVTRSRPGGLEQLFERLGLELPGVPLAGRAADRLGYAAAILGHLLAIAPELARDTPRHPTLT